MDGTFFYSLYTFFTFCDLEYVIYYLLMSINDFFFVFDLMENFLFNVFSIL